MLFRSYHAREFFDLLESIDRGRARLENPLALMKWNMDKTYLRDLEERGVSIVPTHWGHGDPTGLYPEFSRELGPGELVIKPRISASASDTYRISHGEALDGVADRFDGRDWMVQPFMDAVGEEGEFSLFYFGGELSHTVLKRPLAGDFRVQEEHGGSTVLVSDPEAGLRSRADAVMAALPQSPLYARVDMVRNHPSGSDFCLMEVELIEPTLFFCMDDQAPERFARAFSRMMA